ncbi:helix-turn-helix transcriptional regulator, partial [bacterium]|nr:helix-turn-helix transcriptional regulator [bacterium]
ELFQNWSPLFNTYRLRGQPRITPYVYIKNRRLEESLRLLKSGQHTVADVALLVGYESFGAFSEAFKEKYGSSPSTYKQ